MKWLNIGIRFIPFINTIVTAIEQVKGAQGAAKLSAAQEAIRVGLEATEFAVEKDLLNDDKVMEAATGYINAYVAVQNAIAAAKAATEAAKASPVKPALPGV